MKFDNVFIVGVGGTGSHLLEPLTKLLAYHENGTEDITIIDGDSFEDKNLTRQLFNPDFVNMNKAVAAQRRFPWLGLNAVDRFINGTILLEILAEKVKEKSDSVLIIMAVDNHATRRDILLAMSNSEYSNYVVFSPGNALDHGQVIVYAVKDGEAITSDPFEKYPDLNNPTDKIPGFGCEAEAVSTPQLITANASAALGVLLTVSAMLDNKKWFEEIHFSCEKLKLVPQGAPVDGKPVTPIAPTRVLPAAVKADELAKKEKPKRKIVPPPGRDQIDGRPAGPVVKKKKAKKKVAK